jgi:molecular chaperone HscA
MRRFYLAGALTNPVQISAEILKYLKEKTETLLGETVEHAVITVPAYFSETARSATRMAASLAGWKVLRLISEPTAAALKFGLDQRRTGRFLIFDLGGGTFDVSILNLEQGIFQILGTGGDTHLGGDDVDHLIKEFLIQKYNLSTLGEEDHKKLLLVAETLKKGLKTPKKRGKNAQKQTKKELKSCQNITLNGMNFEFCLQESELNQIVTPLLERIDIILKDTMKAADLSYSDINEVVLVGGSTRLNFLHKYLEKLFQKPPLSDLNPDYVVAEGAALQAYALTHKTESLLLDVTALSLGIETMGGLVEKIIHRNAPIPAVASQNFTTFQDNQSAMSIHIVQGEREIASDCQSLGRFVLKGIPPLPAGFARISVTFTIDADGLLTVSAQEQTTGIYQSIEVTPSHGLDENELKEILLKSYQAATMDMKKRTKEQEWIKLQYTLNLCEKLLTNTDKGSQKLKDLLHQGEKLKKEEETDESLRTFTKFLEEAFKAVHTA